MRIHNTHARKVARPASDVFAALVAVGTAGDRLWPVPSMPFERTPGPLRVGETEERHGIIHAVLDELEPDRKLVWRANQPFIRGTHGFEITETDQGCHVVHVLDGHVTWWFAPVWVMKVRAIHDRILESLLDRLESPLEEHVRATGETR